MPQDTGSVHEPEFASGRRVCSLSLSLSSLHDCRKLSLRSSFTKVIAGLEGSS